MMQDRHYAIVLGILDARISAGRLDRVKLVSDKSAMVRDVFVVWV